MPTLLFVAFALRADSPPPSTLKALSLEELSQIEVTTASRAPEKVLETPAAVHVITGEDIRRSGATTIPEALRMVPGVEVARIDSHTWSVGIRGFGSNLTRSVLVLIDGRTVYTTLLAGTYWDVQNTNLDDVDRIEVIRGPGGTSWGPNAVNGVINIITRSAKDTHGVRASAGGGSEEQGFVNLRYGGGNNRGLDYRVYGMGFTRSPQYHPDGRNFDDWRAAQGGFRMDWQKTSRDQYTVQGDFYTQDSGQSAVATSYTPPFSRTVDETGRISGGNLMGRWTRDLGNGNDVQVQLYYERANRRQPNFTDIRDTYDADFLQHARLRDRHHLTWGLGTRFSHGSNPVVVSGLTFTPPERTDQLYTAFLQDEIQLVEQRLSVTLGTKMLRTNFLGFGVEPSARLLFTPSAKSTFWTAFTHALRTPSDGERNFNLSGFIGTNPAGVPFFARFNANPDFAPEQLNGYEFGYRRLLGKTLYLDFATFFNHYHDLFSEEVAGSTFVEDTPAPTHLLLPAQFRNGLRGNTLGGEMAAEWRPAEHWRLRPSYSYLQMALDKTPQSADFGTAIIIEGSSPKHQVTMQSSVDITRALLLDLTYRYVSELAGLKVPAYSTGDVRIAWRVNRDFELSVVGQNLFEPSHPESSGDPGPLIGIRRSAYAKITWTH